MENGTNTLLVENGIKMKKLIDIETKNKQDRCKMEQN